MAIEYHDCPKHGKERCEGSNEYGFHFCIPPSLEAVIVRSYGMFDGKWIEHE